MEQLKWLKVIPQSGVMGILGKRRQGKTALAYHIAEQRHSELGLSAVVLGPPLSMKSKFPNWFSIITDLKDFIHYPAHTAILDEGSLPLHARRSLSRDHSAFDQALSLCGQLNQLFIFNTHHSRKLDILAIEEYEVLAFKFPGKMHTVMERPEIRPWSQKAREVLLTVPEEERKAWTYVFYDDLDQAGLLTNPLPSFWCDEISKAVSIAVTQERGDDLDTLVREQETKIPEVVWCKQCGRPAYMLDGQCERCEYDRVEKLKELHRSATPSADQDNT
jgi:ribosomal protein L37E